ncbi:MAG: glucose-6-phosphate dehydrogenase assembly protein OpcA [Actinomycetia bacterium]|nr:glucose-6-phosphate dehydrogenase assembly protein OpcA [Actinomycetes bacterium]MCH9802007.1 glucose-6-phosphate dehydrogenase assembly protein OpcA [Actinomycetes bacterium]
MIRLENTTGNDISAEITRLRHRMGAPATGMVLTLLILADETSQADATLAATQAAHEHPMRILVLIPRPDSQFDRLDAEISVGGDDGPGEVVVMRLRGVLAEHAGSVAIPLLLSDTPIVAWWPHDAPEVPQRGDIGAHSTRRITNAMSDPDQVAALKRHAEGYQPGDTDLAWTQITGWRTLLASTLDANHPQILGAEVHVLWATAAAHLLAAWLGSRLKVPVSVVESEGPGITEVRLLTAESDITIVRPDGRTATLEREGQAPATIALPRRDWGELMLEELRRLDPDEIYGEALQALDQVGVGPLAVGVVTEENGDG